MLSKTNNDTRFVSSIYGVLDPFLAGANSIIINRNALKRRFTKSIIYASMCVSNVRALHLIHSIQRHYVVCNNQSCAIALIFVN